MITQITSYGIFLMQTATEPIKLTSFRLGSAYDYVPSIEQATINGSLIYSGLPADPVVSSPNVITYYIELGSNLGPFAFGEIGLYYGGHLFAICVLDTPMQKDPLNENLNTGGAIVIDFNVPSIGQNYQMWSNVAQANTTKVSVVGGPEELPQSVGVGPNLYVIDSTSGVAPFLAYTDRNGLWSFDTYSLIGEALAFGPTQTTVRISPAAAQALQIEAGAQSALMVQYASGTSYASVRWVEEASIDGLNGQFILQLNSPIFTGMANGNELRFYRFGAPTSTTINISSTLTVKDIPGSYTLVISDQDAVYLRVDSEAPATIYVPNDETVAFPIGTNLLIGWQGLGQVLVAPLTEDVTVVTPSTNMIAQRYGKIAIIKVAPNVWELEGNLQQ